MRARSLAIALLFLATMGAHAQKQESIGKAIPLTQPGQFTEGIEGPACDRDGFIYAVNYREQGTIGRINPDGKGEVWAKLPSNSVGNGIVFNQHGQMFVADYTGHNVLRIDPATKKISVHAHNHDMNQPNDLAIMADGTLFASDPNWPKGTGQLWRIDTDGTTHRVAVGLGTTNGIDVSPDGKILYVNESKQRNLWAFPIRADKTLGEKKLLKQFPDFGFDGMRLDVAGNLHITRHGKGTVVVLSPMGEILKEIDVLGGKPSNLCFGGKDGRTVYVTEVDHTRLVMYRSEHPGLAWARNQGK